MQIEQLDVGQVYDVPSLLNAFIEYVGDDTQEAQFHLIEDGFTESRYTAKAHQALQLIREIVNNPIEGDEFEEAFDAFKAAITKAKIKSRIRSAVELIISDEISDYDTAIVALMELTDTLVEEAQEAEDNQLLRGDGFF